MKRINYSLLGVISVFVGIVATGYIVGLRKAVSRQAERWEPVVQETADRMFIRKNPEIKGVPGYEELLRKRGLLRGIVEMARGDSVGLFLNLPDSTAHLMIKGAAVRNIPIRRIGLSPFFDRLSREALYEGIAHPFRTEAFRTTIPKEPVNVVRAPKDSSDSVPLLQPDTTHTEPVFFVLDTDKQLRFYFYQTEGGWTDSWTAFRFGWTERCRKMKADIGSLLQGRLPEYRPVVRIGISKEDAKVIFRALPMRGEIVLTF